MPKSLKSQPIDELWAITSYFNPVGYRCRYKNYLTFRDCLNVPLVTVELSYGAGPELREGDADILIQLPGRDVMWQKERLLNIAMDALPSTCRKVIWLDCDIIFVRNDWAKRTSLLLDRFQLVQPFKSVRYVPEGWDGAVSSSHLPQRWSVPFLLASGLPVATCLGARTEGIPLAPGHAWAARRELLTERRLYDACVVGGGDSAMVRAAYGCMTAAIAFHQMHPQRADHFLRWALPFYETVRRDVSFLEGELVHLWHGEAEHRSYFDRYAELAKFEFNPSEDIAIDRTGCWRWSSNKAEMHQFLRAYFTSRKEDG